MMEDVVRDASVGLQAWVTTSAVKDGQTFYAVDVNEGLGGHRVWKRYKMFAHLKDRLAQVHPQLANVSFPGKALFPLNNASLTIRRRQLDRWLAWMIHVGESGEEGAEEVRKLVTDFLKQEGEALSDSPAFDPPEGPAAVTAEVASHEEQDGVIFYKVDVRTSCGMNFTVSKSFNQFYNCNRALSPHVSIPFPSKVLLSYKILREARYLHSLKHDSLEGRLQELNEWLKAALQAACSTPRVWSLLQTFLDPRMAVGDTAGLVGDASVPDARVVQYQELDGVMFFAIDVVSCGVVWKRYNMLSNLRVQLECADPLCDAGAGFPVKAVMRLDDAGLEERREQLDIWLQGVIRMSRHEEGEGLRAPLLAFLRHTPPTPASSSLSTQEDPTVTIPTTETRDGTVFYAVQSGGNIMWKSFSMFQNLYNRLEHPPAAPPFPSRVLYNYSVLRKARNPQTLTEEAITFRREELEAWLQAAVRYSPSPAIDSFLNPDHPVTLS